MTTPDRLGVETQLSVADAYLQKNEPVNARRLLVDAKIRAGELGLENLVHSANRSLAVSHLNEGNNHYNAGRLAEADAKYPEAEHAYTEFAGSFEEDTLSEHLGGLYTHWVDSNFQLGKKSHEEGNALLASETIDEELVLKSLGLFDIALDRYGRIVQIHDTAQGKGLNIDSSFKTVSEQQIIEIKRASVQWANRVHRPDIAEKYLQ